MDKPFPAYRGDDPYVFVCYAHADEAIVYPELGWLNDRGVHLWYDEGISAGRVWRGEIADAITGATRLVFYVSTASLASEHCRREIHYALDKGVSIVPVYLDDARLTSDLEIGLNLVQALYRRTDTNYQQHLLNALGEHAAERIAPVAIRQPLTKRLVLGFSGVLVVVALAASWWLTRDPSATPPMQVEVAQKKKPHPRSRSCHWSMCRGMKIRSISATA